MARVEILTIGDELVEGRLVDSNSALMSERLVAAGLTVARHCSVADDRTEIVAALRGAAARSDAVLVSGGLGPTSDDLTAACAADAFDRALVMVPEALDHVRRFFSERGRSMSSNNEKQAALPEGCEILPNPWGTAVGFGLREGCCELFFMPGVPRELAGIFDQTVLPRLVDRLGRTPAAAATLKLFGAGESDVAQRLTGLGDALPPAQRPYIQYRASFPEIHLRLVLEPAEGVEDRLATLVADARERLGRVVYAAGGARVDDGFADVVLADLAARQLSVAVADAFTGGGLSAMLHAAPAAGDLVVGSVVAASAAALLHLCGAGDTAADGGADLQLAAVERAASAVRRHAGADLGIALAGTAAEASEETTLWVAVADADGVGGRRLGFRFDPPRMRVLAAYVALEQLRRHLGN